jgi:hypothetical protein
MAHPFGVVGLVLNIAGVVLLLWFPPTVSDYTEDGLKVMGGWAETAAKPVRAARLAGCLPPTGLDVPNRPQHIDTRIRSAASRSSHDIATRRFVAAEKAPCNIPSIGAGSPQRRPWAV